MSYDKETLMNLFKDEWSKCFDYSFIKYDGRIALQKLVRDERFSKLSGNDIATITFTNKSAINRLRSGELLIPKEKPSKRSPTNECLQNSNIENAATKKPGRPPILSLTDENYIIDSAVKKRQIAMAVSMQWATMLANQKIHEEEKKVSRYTISRVFKKRKWKRRKSMRCQGYRLTASYDTVIMNWIERIKSLLLENPYATVHVMDESGIHTNMFPRYTYIRPGEKIPYVEAHPDTTKDTVVVTLSSTGNADLYYVPFRTSTESRKGCSGVGIDEMQQWTMHFLTFAQRGDILIMDNLAAHRNPEICRYLKENGIIVKFFPIRGAAKLSPLDNCFFAIFKYHCSEAFHDLIGEQGENLRRKKLEIIKSVFTKLIEEGIGISYFKHCGYDDMGLKFGSSTVATFGRIPFSFEETTIDQPFFPKIEPEIPMDIAEINSRSNIRFIPALTSVLYSNQYYRNLISASDAIIIKHLNSLLCAKGKVTINSVIEEFGTDDLEDIIKRIHAEIGNIIVIFNRETKTEDTYEYLSIKPNVQMPVLITRDVLKIRPSVLVIFIEQQDERCKNFSFPEDLYCHSIDMLAQYKLTGIIVQKSDKLNYYSVIKSNKTWIKFDSSWKEFAPNDINDVYKDTGAGQAVVLFYNDVTEATEREIIMDQLQMITSREPFKDRSICDIIIQNKTAHENVCSVAQEQTKNSCTVATTEDEIIIKAQNQKYTLKHFMTTRKNIGHFKRVDVPGIYNPYHTCHINTAIQALFLIKEFVKDIDDIPVKKSPIKELDEIFKLLDTKANNWCVDPRNLINALNLDTITEDDPEFTMKDLLTKIDKAINPSGTRIMDFLLHDNENPGTLNLSSIIIDEKEKDILKTINDFFNPRALYPHPQVIIVSINADPLKKHLNPFIKRDIPFNFQCNHESKIIKYKLYSIIAYSNKHYMIYNRESDNSWIGIDDDISFEIQEELILNLFGYDENDTDNAIYKNLHRYWIGHLFFYKQA